jgi:hypothetical protein
MTVVLVCLTAIIILLIAFTILVLFITRKHFLATFSNRDVVTFRNQAINIFGSEGYTVKDKGKRVYVEKRILTATSLCFEQNGLNVDVYRRNSASLVAWILTILGAFFFMIGAMVVGGLAEDNSKKFAVKTLLPLLQNISDKPSNK